MSTFSNAGGSGETARGFLGLGVALSLGVDLGVDLVVVLGVVLGFFAAGSFVGVVVECGASRFLRPTVSVNVDATHIQPPGTPSDSTDTSIWIAAG